MAKNTDEKLNILKAVKAFVKGHTSSFEEYSSAHRLYIARKDRR